MLVFRAQVLGLSVSGHMSAFGSDFFLDMAIFGGRVIQNSGYSKKNMWVT